jgi:hypothetical protein
MLKPVKYVLEYFTHASTWKGVFGLLTALGVTLAPELQNQIITLGLSAIGLIQILIDDNTDKK